MKKYLTIAALAAVLTVSGVGGAQAQSGKVMGVDKNFVAAEFVAPVSKIMPAQMAVDIDGYANSQEAILNLAYNDPAFNVSKISEARLHAYGFANAKEASDYVAKNLPAFKRQADAVKAAMIKSGVSDVTPSAMAAGKCRNAGGHWGLNHQITYDSNGNVTGHHWWIGCSVSTANAASQ